MAIKKYKPTSPARRFMSVSTFEEITSTTPERSLLGKISKNGGRNNVGRLTVRHHGGGNTRKYRIIDFKRDKDGIPAKVATIEYDPNRSANIALLHYAEYNCNTPPNHRQLTYGLFFTHFVRCFVNNRKTCLTSSCFL